MSTEPVETELNNKHESHLDENDLSNSDIVTKYRTASNIANAALKNVLAAVKPGIILFIVIYTSYINKNLYLQLIRSVCEIFV